jgi:hypothetical protein
MRCRKVRSYLSSYCRGELPQGRQKAVLEHLNLCPDCRREESVCREMESTLGRLESYRVSPDFNSRLLDRIARERFKEARTKAFLPRRAPVVRWERLAPVVAITCLMLGMVFFGGIEKIIAPDQTSMYAENSRSNQVDLQEWYNRYMEVQPGKDRALVQHTSAGWAFKKQLARANRIKDLMNRLASQEYFIPAVSGSDAWFQNASWSGPYNPNAIPVRNASSVAGGREVLEIQ